MIMDIPFTTILSFIKNQFTKVDKVIMWRKDKEFSSVFQTICINLAKYFVKFLVFSMKKTIFAAKTNLLFTESRYYHN